MSQLNTIVHLQSVTNKCVYNIDVIQSADNIHTGVYDLYKPNIVLKIDYCTLCIVVHPVIRQDIFGHV